MLCGRGRLVVHVESRENVAGDGWRCHGERGPMRGCAGVYKEMCKEESNFLNMS